jgi:hypothetical protein
MRHCDGIRPAENEKNGLLLTIFQLLERRWAGRAKRAGIPGLSSRHRLWD